MERLTFKRPDGFFGVIGMDSKNEETKLYMCVRKLTAYEETGLNPNDIDNLKQEVERLRDLLEEESSLAARLKTIRKSWNVTQEGLSKVMDINRATVVKWEKGTAEPSISQAKKLAKYFNVNVSFLIGED